MTATTNTTPAISWASLRSEAVEFGRDANGARGGPDGRHNTHPIPANARLAPAESLRWQGT